MALIGLVTGLSCHPRGDLHGGRVQEQPSSEARLEHPVELLPTWGNWIPGSREVVGAHEAAR